MLNRGQQIQAKLIEAIDKDHWIVSFEGQLLQVTNSTPLEFKKNLVLNLKVIQGNPLRLSVLSEAPNKGRFEKLI